MPHTSNLLMCTRNDPTFFVEVGGALKAAFEHKRDEMMSLAWRRIRERT